MALKVDSRFCEYEVKELRSPACSRQVNAIFPPHNHKTLSPPISIRPSLYTTAVAHRADFRSKFQQNCACNLSARGERAR